MSGDAAPAHEYVIVRGRDNTVLGNLAVEPLGSSLAVGISPGAVRGTSMDANEDSGAVVLGPRASLLVVADGHHGCEASEVAVEHVLEVLGADPRPADLSDEELATVFFDAGTAIQLVTSRAGFPHPDSGTTLALALVTEDAVQWAALGDSCVVLATSEGAARLDVPRNAYLGYGFTIGDVAAALTRGRTMRRCVDQLVLATDGLVDALAVDGLDVEAAMLGELQRAVDATRTTERLLRLALERGASDAVTVAVAAGRRSE